MTVSEVVWFMNHRYGERAYVVEAPEETHLFTRYSEWVIFNKDKTRFQQYKLYHSNNMQGEGYHTQLQDANKSWLVFRAIQHDSPEKEIKTLTYGEFERLWDMFLFGRQVEAEIATWDFLSKGEENDS